MPTIGAGKALNACHGGRLNAAGAPISLGVAGVHFAADLPGKVEYAEGALLGPTLAVPAEPLVPVRDIPPVVMMLPAELKGQGILAERGG